MATHNDLGREGERIAREHLEREGYKILARNYVYRKAEVDLIVRKDNVLAAIEVKTRSKCTLGRPQDFVSPEKIRLMVSAVNEFVRIHQLDCEVRLDIIAVSREGRGFRVEHLRDAFYCF